MKSDELELEKYTIHYIEVYILTNWVKNIYIIQEKSLKIPKGQSASVYQKRTDNTMAKRKSTKAHTTI